MYRRAGVLLVGSLLGGTAGAVRADELAVGYTVEVATYSSYVSRGDRITSTSVEGVVQPAGELRLENLGPGTLIGGVWSSLALTETDSGQEIDPYLAYAAAVGPVALRGGYQINIMPAMGPVDDVHELTLQADLEHVLPVVPYAGVAIDAVRTDGLYGYGGLAHSTRHGRFSLCSRLNLGASEYAELEASLQDLTVSTTAQLQLDRSGLYAAATLASAWSGRANEHFPYAGVSVGISR
jgi:hypothetical protein